MKKKSVLRSVTAMAMALGICLSSSMIAYASPSIAVDFSVAVTNTGESRTYMDSLMGITYQTTINEVSDINATFKINKAGTSQISVLSEIQYGYLDGDKFVRTYTNDGIYKSNQSNEGNMDATYPIFHVEQVQKDLQAGITDRVYVTVVDGLNPSDWTDNFFAYTFRLTGNGNATTPPAQQTEGWVQDNIGWWYRNTDGSYPVNTWKEINGKHYYFGSDGYMLHDTVTPDGYQVGPDGAWIQNSLSDEKKQQTINELTELYTGAFYIDQAEFEQNVRAFFTDPAEAQYVIDLIRSNHTFVPDTSLQDTTGGIDTSGWDTGGATVEYKPLDDYTSLTDEQIEKINNSSWG